jgi:hypothetical protein
MNQSPALIGLGFVSIRVHSRFNDRFLVQAQHSSGNQAHKNPLLLYPRWKHILDNNFTFFM